MWLTIFPIIGGDETICDIDRPIGEDVDEADSKGDSSISGKDKDESTSEFKKNSYLNVFNIVSQIKLNWKSHWRPDNQIDIIQLMDMKDIPITTTNDS